MKYEKFLAYERRAYSTVYSEREGSFHDDIIRQLASTFLPQLTKANHAMIIDIGSGPGIFLESARALGYQNLVGVTLSDEDVTACQQRGFQTIKSSMSDLDLADESVDVIWCRHALEHSPYPLFTLYEFDRVLRPQGRMLIEVPAPDNARAFIHEYNPNHYSIMGLRMWDGLFEKSGFEIDQYFNSTIDVDHEGATLKEMSIVFLIRKSQESIESKFSRKYGIHIQNHR